MLVLYSTNTDTDVIHKVLSLHISIWILQMDTPIYKLTEKKTIHPNAVLFKSQTHQAFNVPRALVIYDSASHKNITQAIKL